MFLVWSLTELQDEICDVVTDIFNKSLRSGDVPHNWS